MKTGVLNLCTLAAAVCACAGQSFGTNLILNGGFETNTSTTAQYNLSNAAWNALVAHTTSFGSGPQLDLENSGLYSGGAPEGSWAAALATTAGSSLTDALALELSQNLIAGQQYNLTFMARTNTQFGTVPSVLEVGISNSSTAFGTSVFTTPTIGQAWTSFSTSFTASGGENQLTLQAQVNGTWHWTWVDDFQLTAVPSASASSALALAAVASLRRRRTH